MRKSSEKLKIILNHKMNLLYKELNEYIKRTNKIKKDIIIAPSNIYLLEFIKLSFLPCPISILEVATSL